MKEKENEKGKTKAHIEKESYQINEAYFCGGLLTALETSFYQKVPAVKKVNFVHFQMSLQMMSLHPSLFYSTKTRSTVIISYIWYQFF